MKPTIYFLDDQIGQGQPKVIRGLANRLILEAANLNLVIRPLDIKDDLVYVIESENLSIGLMSHENRHQAPKDLIRFLEGEDCQIIFCSSVSKQEMNKSIANLVSNNGYQSIYLNSAFSSLFQLDQLLKYEVSKLLEIVKISIEYCEKNSENSVDFLREFKAV
jgi:uncharacterized HAD superfamily protein